MIDNFLINVYIANGLGIALLLTLFFGNRGRAEDDRDLKLVLKILLVVILACIADPVVYTVDGKPGLLNTILIYVGNSWLYIANILVSRMWLSFYTHHLNLKVMKGRRIFWDTIFAIGGICILINPFYPIVFSVTENVYKRGMFYWIFVVLAGILLIDSVVIYLRIRFRGGVFYLFPIQVFIIPVVIGVAVQSVFYGISVIWASVAIAVAGVSTSLKNEVIYTDRLTGVYSRAFLDFLQKSVDANKITFLSGIMLDLNDFKHINDEYGHTEGDLALKETARILLENTQELGNVIRYAGDEFVIILNTVEEQRVKALMEDIRNSFDSYNLSSGKPYQLTASMGYSIMDVTMNTMNDFMNVIDDKMYENKEVYYKEHGVASRHADCKN